MRLRKEDRLAVKRPTPSAPLRAYSRLCESLDSPVSLANYLRVKYGEWDQLALKKVKPSDYLDGASFRIDYLAVSVLSKAEFLPTSFNRREAAKEKFWEAEEQCRATNDRLWAYACGRLMPRTTEIHGVLHRARELILRVLTDSPSSALKGSKIGVLAREASLDVPRYRFGPGVTSVVKRYIAAAQKYTREIHVTPSLYPFWRDIAGPRWASHVRDVSLKASNKVTFVPKNAKTFRTIAVEPHLNGYAQLGIAGLLRRRLRQFGVDIATQADVNRWAVRSLTGIATIDLSSASDTLSRELVWLLLPEEWARLLDTIRSPYGELDGVEFEYQKFSSMGNGCTFELETLIFWALAQATGSTVVEVFGDDIIVDSQSASLLLEVLDFCGFAMNAEKTFTTGPFRESCGVDVWDHEDVRPFFWKELDIPLWFKMANDIRQWSLRCEATLRRTLLTSWLSARAEIPEFMRCTVPPGFDSYGVVDRPPTKGTKALDHGWDGYAFTGWAFRPRKVPIHDSYQAYLYCLDGGNYEGTGQTSFRDVGQWQDRKSVV